MPTVITMFPKARSSARNGSGALVRSAVEPSGSGAYVEAVREWIDRVTPCAPQRPQLRLVR